MVQTTESELTEELKRGKYFLSPENTDGDLVPLSSQDSPNTITSVDLNSWL